jgi:MoaA/NifB/PqqE/SkfB family radical SAM enzyme
MPNSKIFCNIPWLEVHINSDGTYESCGAQPNHHMFGHKQYNVHQMTIPEWINSEHQRDARLKKLQGIKEPLCDMCYHEEIVGSSSKRIKENFKSCINPINFEKTYRQSPDHLIFEYSRYQQGLTNNLRPNSYHISLGNECNLACKMCNPRASSRLAVEAVKEGTWTGPIRSNWSTNQSAWEHVVNYICSTEDLKYVHLIGGEPLLNPRFEELVDQLLAAGKQDIYLGFTTNGTVLNIALIEKLNQFKHVDIGISIETADQLNDYIRKGSNTAEILSNIDVYLQYRKQNHVYITVRPVPSALSVHTLDDLYYWCIDRKIDVMTNVLVRPEYQQIRQLPDKIKQRLLNQYSKWEFSEPIPGISNPRDPNRFKEHIDSEVRAVIKSLELPGDLAQTKLLYDRLQSWGWLDQPEIAKYFV